LGGSIFVRLGLLRAQVRVERVVVGEERRGRLRPLDAEAARGFDRLVFPLAHRRPRKSPSRTTFTNPGKGGSRVDGHELRARGRGPDHPAMQHARHDEIAHVAVAPDDLWVDVEPRDGLADEADSRRGSLPFTSSATFTSKGASRR
jgi:hypothetical protein